MKKSSLVIPEVFQEKVNKLIAINEEYSRRYQNQLLKLENHRHEHPTKMLIFKCGDGRILFAGFTETPLGFLRNFRNIGGKFNFGWEALRNAFTRIAEQAYEEKRGCLAIITYHYSKGDDPKRGCAGYKYDIEASIRGAMGFKGQMERAYRGLPHQVVPIVVGIETDEDALILHNDHGKFWNLATVTNDINESEVLYLLSELYPEMPLQMRIDLLPLVMGNVRHIAKVRETKRPIVDMEHKEWIVGVGGAMAFDFLHVPNTAILVGHYNPNLGKVIKEAFKVIKSHWKEGNKFLTLAAAGYGKTHWGTVYEQHAMESVRYYNRLVKEVAHEHFHELVPHMFSVRGLVNVETQKMKLV